MQHPRHSPKQSTRRSPSPRRQQQVTVPPTPTITITDTGIVERFARVSLLRREDGWHFKLPNGRSWWPGNRVLTDDDLRAHLTGACWVGCRAPLDGHTDRLSIDVDAKSEPGRPPSDDQLADRARRYWIVREAMGRAHVPLVVQTPGGGLRVLYRIPRQPLAPLIDGRDGLVADVIRGAGGEVRNGRIELFPQYTQVDRMPLGRSMPILCPDTLAVMLEPARERGRESAFEEAHLVCALAHVEAWHTTPLETLIAFLNTRPRVPLDAHDGDGVAAKTRCRSTSQVGQDETAEQVRPGPVSGGPSGAIPTEPDEEESVFRQVTSPRMREVMAYGSRRREEWDQGLAMMLNPSAFESLGLPRNYTHEQFARALATWLRRHNHGRLRDWNAALRRGGSEEGAQNHFTELYLRRDGADGSNLVERLERTARTIRPECRRVDLVSPVERRRYLAPLAHLTGATRFRAEVWTLSLAGSLKRLYRLAQGRGEHPPAHTDARGRRWVDLRIPTVWMEGWDYGKGADAAALKDASRYLQYLRLLESHALITQLGGVVTNVRPDSETAGARPIGRACLYRAPFPELDVRVSDVGIDPRAIQIALDASRLTKYRRTIKIDQALHCLAIASDPRGIDPAYGRDIRQWILEVSRALAPLASASPHPAA